MLDVRLYLAQRLSAMVMVPLVLTHIGVMIYAIQGGLSTAEILGRTQGSIFWFAFYGLFVVSVAIHAAIGIRSIASEWAGLNGWMLGLLTIGIALLLFSLGIWSVLAVTLL